MFKRYFDENKKGLDHRIQEGPYVLECATEAELARSGDTNNITWSGDTPSLRPVEEVEAENLQRQIDAMTTIAKLDIRRAFRAIGKEADLDVLIGSSPEMTKDWQDAVSIDLSDPSVTQALEGANIDVNAIKTLIIQNQKTGI